MVFVETPIFTRRVKDLLSDEEYRGLQLALLLRPEQGALIRGGAGLRKIRWAPKGTGKRGGVRVIYFWEPDDDCIYMLLVYLKTAQDDLTREQLRILARVVREELK